MLRRRGLRSLNSALGKTIYTAQGVNVPDYTVGRTLQTQSTSPLLMLIVTIKIQGYVKTEMRA